MLEVQENKRSLIYDLEVLLTNVYLKDQIRGDEVYKIVHNRKKVPLNALDLWKYDLMRQNDIFSEPLVHGMCTVLRNAYMAEFPQDGVIDEQMQKKDRGMVSILDLNQSPPQQSPLEQRGMVDVLDLNQSPPQHSPPEQRGMVAVLDLNQSPPQHSPPEQRGMVAVLELNQSPPQHSPPEQRGMVNEEMQDQKIGLDDVLDQPDEEMQDQKIGLYDVLDQPDKEMQDQKIGLDDVLDKPDEEMQDQKIGLDDVLDQPDEEMQEQKRSLKRGLELTTEERYGSFFALEIIKRRYGEVRPEDKQLIASMLKTSVRTIERIWKTARDQIEKGQKVDVSNQRKGHVGRKRKDLQLSRVRSIPLNQRRTIRSLARSLGVKRSTLHLRFKCGELKRHTSSLKPLLTEENKIKRLEFILAMLDEESLSSLEPTFKVMDDTVHLDEKWFILERENNTYYLHPEEAKPFDLRNLFYCYHTDDEDGFCSFCALKEHAEESIIRSGSVLVPTRFKDNLSSLIPGQQEDAHEFLRLLLDNLHKCTLDPNSLEEESIVKQVFGGRLKSQLTCHDCGHCSEIFEPFLDLSLDIDQVDNLVDALKSFTKVEQIGDEENKITYDSCNANVCKDKRLLIDKAPDVVAFQLKRFTTLEKIDKRVSYPLELDLKLFHSNPEKKDVKYELYGIVEHTGLPNYGHYVCAIRSSPSSWHLMNDSVVDSISETRALGQEAYILFYVRQGMFPWFSRVLHKATKASATEITNPERPSTPPPRPKRMYSVNDHDVFAFQKLDEEDTALMSVTEHRTKVKKPKTARFLDQNVSKLMMGMTSARRKGLLDCIVTQRQEHKSQLSSAHPVLTR